MIPDGADFCLTSDAISKHLPAASSALYKHQNVIQVTPDILLDACDLQLHPLCCILLHCVKSIHSALPPKFPTGHLLELMHSGTSALRPTTHCHNASRSP